MQHLKPALTFALIFGAVMFLSFHQSNEAHSGDKIDGYTIILPDKMPKDDGLFWVYKQGDSLTISTYNSREYQVELDIDSTEIWDGDRLVGKIPYDSASKFDQLMTNDNE